LRVISHKVNLAPELFGFAGLQSADARIVVQADNHALKQLLRFVPGHSQQIFVVPGKATDEAIDRLIEADGARVHVVGIDSFRHVNLAAGVNRFLGSTRFVERGQAALGEDKTFDDVVGLIASGETINPHARMKPLNVHKLVSVILQFELKINVVLAGTNVVQDIDIRLHQSPKLK